MNTKKLNWKMAILDSCPQGIGGYEAMATGDIDGDGIVGTQVAAEDSAHDAVLQTDGKILLVGHANSDRVALARYNQDGSLDTSLDEDGVVITRIGNGADRARGVALQGVFVQCVDIGREAAKVQVEYCGTPIVFILQRRLTSCPEQIHGESRYSPLE